MLHQRMKAQNQGGDVAWQQGPAVWSTRQPEDRGSLHSLHCAAAIEAGKQASKLLHKIGCTDKRAALQTQKRGPPQGARQDT